MAVRKKSSKPVKDHYSDTAKEIADIFIKALEEETLPWHSGFDKFRYIPPFNPANGTVYQGMNSFNFALKSYIRGYRDPRFMTMSQANELGGKVKKGEHCIWGFNFKPTLVLVKDEEGNPVLDDKGQKQYKEMIFPKPFMVFNVEQFDGLNLPKIPEIEQPDHKWTPDERAENLLKESKANISNELTCLVPHYSPLADKITLPMPNQYHDAENYYSTALHELSHWTGHSSRLNRDFAKDKHTQKYAREELRAEIGSAMVNMMLGIAPKISENNKAYIKGWIAHLKEEPKEILRACGDAEKISDYIMNFDPEYVKTKEACQNQKLLTDSEPITQQNLETAVADAKTLTSQRENDDVVKQLSAIVEEAEKGYREIYNKGKERGYYQDVDFDTFEEIYTRTALSAIPKEDSQTREDHEEWSVERLVDAVAHDPETSSKTSLEFEMPPMAYLHWSESKELEKAFGKNRFLPLSKANEVVQKLNNSYPPDSGYDKSQFSVLYFKRNASGLGFKDESYEHFSYDIGSEPKNSDLSTHIRDYVDGVLKGDEDFLYTSEYSQQKELKERKARLADYKEQIVPVFEQYSKECSKAQNQIIEAVAEPAPAEIKETPQSLTDLFANFDKAGKTPNNNNINQPAADKTPAVPLLDDEVKVVGFNNDSDLTVLNSPTQSHKSPDIER